MKPKLAQNLVEQGARSLSAVAFRVEQPLLSFLIGEVTISDALASPLGESSSVEAPAARIDILDLKNEWERDAEGSKQAVLEREGIHPSEVSTGTVDGLTERAQKRRQVSDIGSIDTEDGSGWCVP